MTQGIAASTYSTTRVPTTFRWPGNKRIGIVFNVAFEGWSEGKVPGIGPMGNPLLAGFLDLNAISWANYGPQRGIQRILAVLGRNGIKSSVMINGVIAERYPDIVRAISQQGHEIVAHSYAMDVIPVYLDEKAELDNIRRTTDLLVKTTGKRPTGWISPRGTPSANTVRLLIQEGFTWIGDQQDDDLPYILGEGKNSLVVLPFNMNVNDMPSGVRYGNPARAMLEAFDVELEYLQKHEEGAGKMDATVHAHVYGRPGGIWVFEEMMKRAKAADVWIGTREEAVAHVRATVR